MRAPPAGPIISPKSHILHSSPAISPIARLLLQLLDQPLPCSRGFIRDRRMPWVEVPLHELRCDFYPYAKFPTISTKPYCPSSTPVLLGRRHHILCKSQPQQRALPLFIKSRARFLLPIPQRTLMTAKDDYSVPLGVSPSLWLSGCAFPSHSLSLSSRPPIYTRSSIPCWCDNLGSLSRITILIPLTIFYHSRCSPNSCAANI
jgi:hypothetical protein